MSRPLPGTRALVLFFALLLSPACGFEARDPSGDDALPGSEELTRVLGSERPFEARLSVGPTHVPCASPGTDSVLTRCRPLPSAGSDVHRRILSLAARAGDAADRGDASGLWTLGLVELLWSGPTGNPPTVAVERLREAALLAPDAPSLQADLAAAHLVRFEAERSPPDLLWAIDRSAAALDRSPQHPAALFNLALAMERLGLAAGAAEIWRRSAKVDSGSGWAREAEARARRLSATAPDRFVTVHSEERAPAAPKIEAAAAADPQGAREYAMDRLLPGWGRAVLDGDTAEADRLLSSAAAVAGALAGAGGDRTVRRLVAWVKEEGGAESHRTARLVVAYGAARDIYRAGDFGGAGEAFRRLEARMGEHDEPLRGWVLYHRGATLMNGGRMDAAEPRFNEALAASDPASLPVLAAKIAWVRGLDDATRGRSAAAIPRYTEAARLLEVAGEQRQLGAVRYLLAREHLELGERARGWNLLHRALADLGARRGSVHLHNALVLTAELASELELPEAAITLQREGVEAAAATGRAVTEAEARIRLARLLVRAGRTDEASTALERARKRAGQVDSESSRAWLRADLLSLAAEAALLEEGRGSAATLLAGGPSGSATGAGNGSPAERATPEALVLEALDEAAAYFESVGRAIRLAPVLARRAEAWLRLGRTDRARADLERVLAMVAEQRRDRDGPDQRAALLDAARPAFDAMAALHLEEGRPLQALATVEAGRPRLSPERPVGPRPEDFLELASRLPPGRAVVVYAVLGDTLAIWTLRAGSDSIRSRRVPLENRDLRGITGRLRLAAARGAGFDAVEGDLRRLHGLLVEPVSGWIADAERLVVVPDGALHAVPFPALLGDEGYLVERASVRVALGLESAVASESATRRHARGGESWAPGGALLVAAPEGGTGLPPLPGAAEEIAALRSLHPDARVLGPGEHDPAELAARLAESRLFHFAGHAVTDPARPERSYLHLEDGGGSEGSGAAVRLTAAEVRSLPLEELELAVLSACRTLTPTGSRSGGFDGLSRSFLAAGAGGVLGTLWEVEDRAAREVVLGFHQAYRRGAEPAEALRKAQLALLASENPVLASPAAWAAFRYTGR